MSSDYFGLAKVGNRKVGDRCAVWNMRSAHDCPAHALGMCPVAGLCGDPASPWPCYAWSDERRRPTVLAYRRRQERAWVQGAGAFLFTLSAIQAERPWVVECRFNEAGDVASQREVDQLFRLAAALPGFRFFGYSARSDLRWAGRPKNLVVNGSGWSRGRMNEYRIVSEYSGAHPPCPGDCRSCGLCKSENGIVIESVLRRPGGRRKVVVDDKQTVDIGGP